MVDLDFFSLQDGRYPAWSSRSVCVAQSWQRRAEDGSGWAEASYPSVRAMDRGKNRENRSPSLGSCPGAEQASCAVSWSRGRFWHEPTD
jgi:hypothetical protein